MTYRCSQNTQAALLLSAPLIAGRNGAASDLLAPREFKQLARSLRERGAEPGDLLGPNLEGLLSESSSDLDRDRVRRLLDRGFLLGQALERWGTRTIWVISRFDPDYPERLRSRLGEDAPAILYGCGPVTALESGGLAMVGSRNTTPEILEYARATAELAATAGKAVVSGGARGIDQMAMSGVLEAGGRAVGVLADSLERAALDRGNRDFLMTDRLTLISPYDPGAGFNVGHAMHRNKLIYALSDVALVVNAEAGQGGSWAGAVEQLEKLRFVPVYVRTRGELGSGLEALRRKGALSWPEPDTSSGLCAIFESEARPVAAMPDGVSDRLATDRNGEPDEGRELELVREYFLAADMPRSEKELIAAVHLSRPMAQRALKKLIEQGFIERMPKPVRYRLMPDRLL